MNMLTRAGDVVRLPQDPSVVVEGPRSLTAGDRGARTLGWVSIGLGLAGLFAAPTICRALGVKGRETVVRACGVRELASGVLCLSVNPGLGLAMRAAGDAADLAALAAARLASDGRERSVDVAIAAVAGLTVMDLACLSLLRAERAPGRQAANGPRIDYSDRSGLPRGVEASRGLARQPVAPSPVGEVGAAGLSRGAASSRS
jgi:hypothetical protein